MYGAVIMISADSAPSGYHRQTEPTDLAASPLVGYRRSHT